MIRERRIGKTQQKILLLLLSGVALGLTRSPRVAWRIIRNVPETWRFIERRSLQGSVGKLYHSKLVSAKPHKDGSMTLVLTQEGKRVALRYNLSSMSIDRPSVWDGAWRVVLYDIPESLRYLRADISSTLKRLGFHELQHSVFIHPYECTHEVEYLIELFEAREYVRFMRVSHIDDEGPLLKHFDLTRASRRSIR